MTNPADTTALWQAVHAITESTRRKIDRDEVAAVEFALDLDTPWARVASATGVIPSLWEQAVDAIVGCEAGDRSGGSTPLRERSVGDLALLETLAAIRETVHDELRRTHHVRPDSVGDTPACIRRHTSLTVAKQPARIATWTRRWQSWERVLRTHLNAVEGPRPVHLRNTPCPTCGASQVTVELFGELRVVPAILIDFAGGLVRAAVCQACGDTWWRGHLARLAELIRTAS